MRYSIKFKLFAALCSLIVFFVVVSWLLNTLFLDEYYLFSKRNILLESFEKISKLYNGAGQELSLELEKLEDSTGMQIIIMDRELNILYNSRQRAIPYRGPGRFGIIANNFNPLLIAEKINELKDGKPLIENRLDRRLNSNFITLYARLNTDYIYMNSPVAAIQESAETANKFFIFTGILTLIVGGFLIFLITSKFTRPILELNEIAQSMSKLNFSRRYPVKSRDEIGHLGESINSLSKQLEKSIFELKDANEKLRKDIERERKIDMMRKEFITNVSHELKTPIALIQGYSEGLKLNVNEDEESKNYYCDVITDEALKMNRLVKHLLDLSQLESGSISLDKSCFDISELVQYVMKKQSIVFNEKNINVAVEKNEDITVCADYERIEQVLMNYLNNAVNHVDDNNFIKVSISRSGDKSRVSVFNSGCHIPQESLSKVWDSFYKVDKARTRAYGGTGVGLSIVRAIQEAHGNGFGVNNVVGGVEFWFDIDLGD